MENGEKCAFGFEGLTSLAEGLTKREYFAAMAMQGILSSRGLQEAISADRLRWEAFAVEMADNLLEELDKTK
jgi:hypothetical protein